jgi:MFS family permease
VVKEYTNASSLYQRQYLSYHNCYLILHSVISLFIFCRIESITSCHTETDPLLPFKHRCNNGELTIRHWALLFFACAFLFGNYFCYELPAALNLQLNERMGTPYDLWQYQLNMLFTAASMPNVICPLLAGIGIDRLGTNTMLITLTTLLCLGQAIFAYGVYIRSFWLMIVGRVAFGMGGGSLEVCQGKCTMPLYKNAYSVPSFLTHMLLLLYTGKITTEWFRGRALAFAMGLNLTFGRLATALNYNLSPWLDAQFSEAFVCWFGFGLCVLSAGATLITIILDRPESRAKAGLNQPDAVSVQKPIMNQTGMPNDLLFDSDACSVFSQDDHINWSHLANFSLSFWLLNIILLTLYGKL